MSTAQPIQVGDVVPNVYGIPITITAVEDGYYASAYGGAWVAQSDGDGATVLHPYHPPPAPPANGDGDGVFKMPKLLTRADLPPELAHVQTLSGGGQPAAGGDPPAPSANGNGAAGDAFHSSFTPIPMRSLLARRFKPQEYLIDGVLAKGNFAILGGRAKSGKSWLNLQSVMCIDSGSPFLGRDTMKAPVLYYALEDGERRLQRRAIALGWQPSEHAAVLFSIANLDDGAGGPGPGIDEIWSHTATYDLIVIDTLTAAMSGKTDERDNSAMGAIINALAQVAHQSDKALVLTHHTGKATNPDDIFFTLRGASAIRGGYDVGLILERKPGEREAILHAESRDLDIRNMTLRQADNGAGWEYVGDANEIEKVRAGRKVLDTLIEHDDGDGLTAKQIADIRKVSEATIHRQLTRLEDDGYVIRDEHPSTQMGKRPDVWRVAEEFR